MMLPWPGGGPPRRPSIEGSRRLAAPARVAAARRRPRRPSLLRNLSRPACQCRAPGRPPRRRGRPRRATTVTVQRRPGAAAAAPPAAGHRHDSGCHLGVGPGAGPDLIISDSDLSLRPESNLKSAALLPPFGSRDRRRDSAAAAAAAIMSRTALWRTQAPPVRGAPPGPGTGSLNAWARRWH